MKGQKRIHRASVLKKILRYSSRISLILKILSTCRKMLSHPNVEVETTSVLCLGGHCNRFLHFQNQHVVACHKRIQKLLEKDGKNLLFDELGKVPKSAKKKLWS